MAKDNSDFFEKKKEWSYIKDTLLGCYLTPYFQKLLISHKPICYVDCFAGEGKFGDGENGSPIIALKIRENCLRRTIRKDKKGAIDMFFIEKDHAAELRENIGNKYSYFGDPVVLDGKFEDKIWQILENKNGQNVFLYIDPYGIKSLDFELFKELGSQKFNSFEMLINFNSFGLFRAARSAMGVKTKDDDTFPNIEELVERDPIMANTSKGCPPELLTKIAGGTYWENIVRDYKEKRINGLQAEQRLSTEYKKHLQKCFRYVLDMPIRLKAQQQPKYRMVHVCNHESGCYLMVKNMLDRKDELVMNVWRDRQLSLFGHDSIAIVEMVSETMDRMPNDINITKFLAEFMTENGIICDFKAIYAVLEEMEADGEIYIKREPPYTKNRKKSTFWEEKGKKRVILSKRQP